MFSVLLLVYSRFDSVLLLVSQKIRHEPFDYAAFPRNQPIPCTEPVRVRALHGHEDVHIRHLLLHGRVDDIDIHLPGTSVMSPLNQPGKVLFQMCQRCFLLPRLKVRCARSSGAKG